MRLRRLYDAQGRLQLRVLGQLIARCIELCWLFAPVALTGLLLHTPLHARCRAPWLRFLVRTLARCGPVGIKWAQWASTRYDLFEEDVCESLGELTNQAPTRWRMPDPNPDPNPNPNPDTNPNPSPDPKQAPAHPMAHSGP